MITVRGRFRSKIYSFQYSGVYINTCMGPPGSIYMDPSTGLYYYSEDEIVYTLASGYYYWGGFPDVYTGDWIWDTIYIDGTNLYSTGQTPSPCGPY